MRAHQLVGRGAPRRRAPGRRRRGGGELRAEDGEAAAEGRALGDEVREALSYHSLNMVWCVVC